MRASIAALIVGSLAPTLLHAADIEVRHAVLDCVPAERYARLSATAVPAESAASAQVQFRLGPDAPWYAVDMAAQDGDWSALLPRPQRSLRRFEYRIVMRSQGGTESATPVAAVAVTDATACQTPGTDSVSDALKIRVPPGAPITPAVPAGFSPAGTIATRELEPLTTRRVILGAAGVGVATAATAVAVSGGSDEPPLAPDVPDFTFLRATPEPGGTLSVSHDQLALVVRMSRQPSRPLTFTWRLDLRSGTTSCLTMQGVFNGAFDPLDLLLTAPLQASAACGETFDVEVGQLTLRVSNVTVWQASPDLPYHVEP